MAGAGDLALAGPQAGQVAGCAAAGKSPAVAAGDNSKRREGVAVTRGGRESGGVPDPGPAAGAGPSLCERGRAECVIKGGRLFSFSVEFKQTRDLSGIRK